MQPEPVRLCVATAPLAIYLLYLGILNLRWRPVLITGPRDMAALWFGVSGLMVVGPMELFMPDSAAHHFGPYIWLLLLAFYGLCVSLAVLLSRPRLVIYNLTIDELRPILAELIPSLDPNARWAGDSISLPKLGVQLHMESFTPMRNISLVASGERQVFDGWRQLEAALRPALQQAEVRLNPRGISFTSAGVLLILMSTVIAFRHRELLAQGMEDLLRLKEQQREVR